ncbi:hypothetical protein V6N12_006469 [Hibiscus sabdariffa]|uniref:Uncharacterized protein n=1 Tax=Hibiscus sabdariffa TaxID=183260 RepID=A0ABR2EYW9_9ROSI
MKLKRWLDVSCNAKLGLLLLSEKMGLRHGVADCKVFCLRTVGAGQDPKISNLYLLIGGASLEKLQLMVFGIMHQLLN